MFVYAVSGLVLIFSYFFWKKGAQPPTILFFKENEHNRSIIARCPSLKNYHPCPILNGFLHTLLSSFKKPKEFHTSNLEEIGDFGITVDWIDKGAGIDNEKPLLFILPGLTGRVTDGYINTIVTEAHKQNFHNICIYNYRMLSPTANFLATTEFDNYGLNLEPKQFYEGYQSPGYYGLDNDFYYFDDEVVAKKRSRVDLSADLHFTLKYLKAKYRFNNILAIGCSYGGAQLGNYLGRFKDKSLINAGVTVGAPHSMIVSQNLLSTPMNLVLTKLLQRKLAENVHLFKSSVPYPGMDIQRALKCWWIEDFDEYFSAKLYGYRTTEAYYRHFSMINRFGDVTVPVLCIAAKDDGVCNVRSLCKDELIRNGKTIVCLARSGGHIGFLEGWTANGIWFPKPALEFLRQFMDL